MGIPSWIGPSGRTNGLDHPKEICGLVACMPLSYDNSDYSLLHERIELVSTPVVIKYFSDVFDINSAVLKVTLIKTGVNTNPFNVKLSIKSKDKGRV